jgi:cobalamin biosynthesis protein CobT
MFSRRQQKGVKMTHNQSNARRLIAAFVALLLGKSAPIRWNDDNVASMTGEGVIRLPAPRVGDETEIALLTRLAVHEGGHKEHTQAGFDQRLSSQELGFFNAIEDARMEGCQVQKYPGATVLLSRGLGEMLDAIQDKVDAGVVPAGNQALQLDLVVRGMLERAPHKPLVDRSQRLLQSLGQNISAEARVAMDEALVQLPLLGTSLDAEALTKRLVARLTQANEQQLQEPEQPETDAWSEGNEGTQESGEPDEPSDTTSESDGDQGESQEHEPDAAQTCGEQPSDTDTRDDAGEEPTPSSGAGASAEDPHDDDQDASDEHDDAESAGGSGNGSAEGDQDSSGADPSPGATAAAGQSGETSSGGTSDGADAGEALVNPDGSQEHGGDRGSADDGATDVDLGTLLREALASRYGDEPTTPSDAQGAAVSETTEADVERLRELFANADPEGPLDQLVQATMATLAQGQTDGGEEAQAAILVEPHGQGTGAGLGLATHGGGSLEINARLQGIQSRLVTVLQRELHDKRRRPNRPAHAGGRVQPQRFWRLGTLGDTKVFSVRAINHGIDAAATILLDKSGSMDSTLERAAEVALAFSLALQRLGRVKTCVSTFPGFDAITETLQPFGVSPRACMRACAELEAGGGTPLGHAMLLELPRLLAQKRLKNWLIVITDDGPADPPQVLQAMQMAREHDVHVVGVAIGCDIRVFIPNSVNIAEATELPNALSKMFKESISAALPA